ncbi:unnamed protein product [Vitrella brassicaformis CCMP3155]|uniref:Uncharacterized protein n=1 Tax=Vitrella brassicaformis (strain CCMP3155) TaxID=1169540 RepID=A0A0G4FMT0_VITBC|nr:unnamed protein product [Vitrella brassicaformis CCMP3155]|eukprot:CEM15489.1 unnamed protein product [Vitrella brassicaformis CCMP3155]
MPRVWLGLRVWVCESELFWPYCTTILSSSRPLSTRSGSSVADREAQLLDIYSLGRRFAQSRLKEGRAAPSKERTGLVGGHVSAGRRASGKTHRS